MSKNWSVYDVIENGVIFPKFSRDVTAMTFISAKAVFVKKFGKKQPAFQIWWSYGFKEFRFEEKCPPPRKMLWPNSPCEIGLMKGEMFIWCIVLNFCKLDYNHLIF